MYDYIVAGAGYGGMSIAALLVKHGFSVLLLESHTMVGGCASCFRRKGFTFDVGATTLSGVLPHQTLGRLFSELSIQPELKKIDPGVISFIGDKKIVRHADKELWIESAVDIFGSGNQRIFWEKVFRTDEKVWNFIDENRIFRPRNLQEYIALMKFSNLKYSSLFFGLTTSIKKVIDGLRLNNDLFRRFINDQLLISTQSANFSAPFVTAAAGLAYPSETYCPYGGMTAPLNLIEKKFYELGGEIKFRKRVDFIGKEKDHYKVTTNKGDTYEAKGVVSNIPIWNMAEITEGKIRKYFRELSAKHSFAWGAFTVYFAVEDTIPLETVYYQIHTGKTIPHCSSNSFFVSFSLRGDKDKAPDGWRTVTISTHTDVANWIINNKDDYIKQKEETTEYIMHNFYERFPELKSAQLLYLLSGTPNSFEFFTGRYNGYVGGIPHSVKNNLLRIPPNHTPFDNLFLVGDTVFPGQGTPAVVLGAFNVMHQIESKSW